jgi:hypothetical protein
LFHQQQQEAPTHPGDDANVVASQKLPQLAESGGTADDAASVDFADFWGLEIDMALQSVDPVDGNDPTGTDQDFMLPEYFETASGMRTIGKLFPSPRFALTFTI